MNIAPISKNNNRVFQGRNCKSFAKGLKKFCGRIIDGIECSTSRVAEAKAGSFTPVKNSCGYPEIRIH